MENIHETKKLINPQTENLLQIFRDNLAKKPYCTDELGHLVIRTLQSAEKKRYIQHNKPTDKRWFVYDLDRPAAHFDWWDRPVPAPNITVMNQANGHTHHIYGLETPVHLQYEARQNPIRYAASIDVALGRLLDADPGYTGLICKNPLHDFWDVRIWQPRLYTLDELADWLDLAPYKDRRRRLPAEGMGRNCTLFERTRLWSYRVIRFGDYHDEARFVQVVIEYAGDHNAMFPVPLPWVEVKSIGKSVGRWTWRHMSPEGFREWGEYRRQKSIEVRHGRSEARAAEVRAYKAAHPEMSNRQIAIVFAVSEYTIRCALKV